MIQAGYTYCAIYFQYYYLKALLQIIRCQIWRLGIPVLEDLVVFSILLEQSIAKGILHTQSTNFTLLKVAQLCPTLCGLYSPWNSPSQNTEVGSLSLLKGIFLTQESNPGLPHCKKILYQLASREALEYFNGQPIPSPLALPDPGIEPGSPALQADLRDRLSTNGCGIMLRTNL